MEPEIEKLHDEAEKLFDQKQYEESIECFDRIIELNRDDDSAWNNKGLALIYLGRYEEAIECYERAIDLNPKESDVWNNKGNALYSSGWYKDAIECYDRAIELNRNYDSAWNNKGAVLYDLEQYEESIECFDRIIELNRDDDSALYKKGNILSKLGRNDEAIECYDEAIKIDPNKYESWNNKGAVLTDLERYKEALKCYEKAVELNPNIDIPWKNKGIVLSHLERYYEATECFEEGNCDIYVVLAMPMLKDKHKKAVIGIMLEKYNSLFSEIVEKHETTEPKEEYKSLFIDSLMIMSKLQVSKDETKQGIAHYTTQEALKKLLLQEESSHFRLHSITLSNDPSEGRTLMDYLYGKGKHSFDDGDNVTLAGSFTFNKDHLNQYRLYGKRDGREATGVSIVFKESFFNESIKPPTSGQSFRLGDIVAKTDKRALFRCIYVDPETRQVIGIGHKEDYTFYRDGLEAGKTDEDIEKEIEKYHSDINDCLKDVRASMQKLREKARELDPTIVGKLLFDLRCLVKHVAFEEEQECRIVKVKNRTVDKVLPNETYQQYYIDYLPIADHIREIYFAPRCENMSVYEAELKRRGIKVTCSTHPLA
jgi:tetratricopeptide (TPR) repeat protein